MKEEILKLIRKDEIILTTQVILREAIKEVIMHLSIDNSDSHHDLRDYNRLSDTDMSEITEEIIQYITD